MVAPTAASAGDRAKMAKGLSSCRMRPATLEMANRAKRSTFCQKGASCMRAGDTRLALLATGLRSGACGNQSCATAGTAPHRTAPPCKVGSRAIGASSASEIT
eukprot:scaffold15072_cov68-Phaeocystis_antarctica.AAC.7